MTKSMKTMIILAFLRYTPVTHSRIITLGLHTVLKYSPQLFIPEKVIFSVYLLTEVKTKLR